MGVSVDLIHIASGGISGLVRSRLRFFRFLFSKFFIEFYLRIYMLIHHSKTWNDAFLCSREYLACYNFPVRSFYLILKTKLHSIERLWALIPWRRRRWSFSGGTPCFYLTSNQQKNQYSESRRTKCIVSVASDKVHACLLRFYRRSSFLIS